MFLKEKTLKVNVDDRQPVVGLNFKANRLLIENSGVKSGPVKMGKYRKSKITDILAIIATFLLKAFFLFERGVRNSKNLVVTNNNLKFDHIENGVNGLRILHISDLHLDEDVGVIERIIEKIGDQKIDLCVYSGDFVSHSKNFQKVAKHLQKLVETLNVKIGHYGVLGNHDSCKMINKLNAIGIQTLMNESVYLNCNGSQVQLVGVDDVHEHYTPEADEALKEKSKYFKIALVHSSEIYDIAEENNVDLYLCGHTHGGQICLPFGVPIFTHLKRGKKFFRGNWNSGRMKGYTSSGAGIVEVPVRFNTKSEITIHNITRR